ncbi:MAG: ABC transporter ATP-binding protein [Deltaproteobacteria bacterium]|nr:ABC transporter ATP-binding protein [Deltaproteobacteria bacterium]
MSSVIRVENLGKKYNLRHQQREQYTAMRDVITDGFKSFARKLIHPFQFSTESGPSSEDFWALKDVTFDVKQGDRIGIIGRNGAGKSTLLKILSRITEPTTGRVRIKGRVASLLEVGTGFHPELTGRENIFLNGAILGMGRAEIRNKFDEIVDFAEIEKFLDTPVKRYSSGMYVRLAFAVAAHLEPEILIVDEVLAVGDSQFQKKCLGKMEDVSTREGRTVLFVSHNFSAINTLCTRSILLSNGTISSYGNSIDITNEYICGLSSKQIGQNGKFDLTNRVNLYNKGVPIILSVTVCDHNGYPSDTLVMGKSAKIQFELQEIENINNLDFGIGFYTPEGFRITSATTWSSETVTRTNSNNSLKVTYQFDMIPFTAGKIMMSPSVSNSKHGIVYDHPEMSCYFNVVEETLFTEKKKISRTYGVIYIDGQWQLH